MAITQNLDSQRFEYTGDVQEFIVPSDGLYKLEVFGASGGTSISQTGSPPGGNGGYSVGYKYLTADTTIYVVVGGKGETCPGPIEQDDGDWGIEYIDQEISGGYNGGGGARSYKNGDNNWIHQGGTGGGATHIALTNRGELENYENFKSEVMIVAGGGGGGSIILNRNEGWIITGGAGGGLEGGIPGINSYDPGTDEDGWSDPDATWDLQEDIWKSTQTSGYQFGLGQSEYSGGGGGLYGGRFKRQAAFGGSGYIGGVPIIEYKGQTYTPSTVSGYNLGNGAAVITLIQKSAPSVYLGSREISAIYYGTRDITDIKIHN